jgi:integrase
VPRRGRQRLTATTLRRPAPAHGEENIGDDASPLIFRNRSDGARSFIVRIKLRGKSIRISCPLLPRIENLEEARRWARDQVDMARKGIDPRHVKQQHRQDQAEAAGLTFELVTRRFMDEYSAKRHKPTTQRDYRSAFNVLMTHNAGLAKRPISTITRSEVREWLADVEKRTSVYRRNRVLAYLRRMLRWAVENDLLTASPVDSTIRNETGETRRRRPLVADDVRRVWAAAKSMGYPFGVTVQLLLLLGPRLREIAELKWSEVDFRDEVPFRLRIPPQRTKTDADEHIVPLPPRASRLIRRCPRVETRDGEESEYVFTTRGTKPIGGFSKFKAELDRLSEVENFKLHDARKWITAALEDLGIADRTIKYALGHSRRGAGTISVYSSSQMEHETRIALLAWERLLGVMVYSESSVWDAMEEVLHPETIEDQQKAIAIRAAIIADDATWLDTFQNLLVPELK